VAGRDLAQRRRALKADCAGERAARRETAARLRIERLGTVPAIASRRDFRVAAVSMRGIDRINPCV